VRLDACNPLRKCCIVILVQDSTLTASITDQQITELVTCPETRRRIMRAVGAFAGARSREAPNLDVRLMRRAVALVGAQQIIAAHLASTVRKRR